MKIYSKEAIEIVLNNRRSIIKNLRDCQYVIDCKIISIKDDKVRIVYTYEICVGYTSVEASRIDGHWADGEYFHNPIMRGKKSYITVDVSELDLAKSYLRYIAEGNKLASKFNSKKEDILEKEEDRDQETIDAEFIVRPFNIRIRKYKVNDGENKLKEILKEAEIEYGKLKCKYNTERFDNLFVVK